MIPVLYNEGPLWLLGITWNAEILAAFFAWWMPLNLLSYLAFMAWGVFHRGWKVRDEAKSLKRLFLAMFLTWPSLAVLLILIAVDELVLQPRRKRRRQKAVADYHRRVRP